MNNFLIVLSVFKVDNQPIKFKSFSLSSVKVIRVMINLASKSVAFVNYIKNFYITVIGI